MSNTDDWKGTDALSCPIRKSNELSSKMVCSLNIPLKYHLFWVAVHMSKND
jgi:hypothetical protein